MAKDLFSKQASGYASFRPLYPQELYDFLYRHVPSFDRAWDCGCGNGQVAQALAAKFRSVNGTDISQKQLDQAAQAANITYTKSAAEQTNFPDNTFDLITVGQALHWFNIPLFFTEARRVAKQNAVVAAWGYSLLSISPQVDPLIRDFYFNVIGPYWDKERAMVDDHYSSVSFPFERIASPEFRFSFQWTVDELLGYMATWSSVQHYIAANGTNPVDPLSAELKLLWGDGKKTVTFPLFMLAGRVSK